MIWTHMDHSCTGSENASAVIGASECELCQPFAREIRRRELTASLIIARRLKSLKDITWDSFYGIMVANPSQENASSENCERADDDSIEHLEVTNTAFNVTSVWIWRDNGRVRAKATPWV
ncbi:hypothetical protein BDQ17DRAFT_1361881 [Cyathus striatus]|nr:hypothetical protein BDQ17DRAFT_1361881 [Cyathus striatus]